MIYQFGEYELDIELYQLRYAGGLRKIEPKAFNVLRYLIQHRDRMVPKEELPADFWKNEKERIDNAGIIGGNSVKKCNES